MSKNKLVESDVASAGRQPHKSSAVRSSGVLNRHDVSRMESKYANVIMLQTTAVDVGIGFGITEFDESEAPLARYHTMMRLSFEQARHLADNLQAALLAQTQHSE